MKIGSFPLIVVWGIVAVTLSPNPRPSRGATVCDTPIATMASVQGNVQVRRAGQSQSQPAQLNDTYCLGDRIQVGDNSRADIALVNQPVLRLDQNTLITLEGMKAEGASVIAMARGALHFFSRLPRNLEVNTAFVNAGVEGTEGLIEAQADQTAITIFDGRVLAANSAGSLRLTSGQSAVAAKGQAPVLRTVVRPRDAVQWALYYPPVTYFRPEEFAGGPPWQGMVRNSLDGYLKGDTQRAFDALKGAPADVTDPRFFAYRASLLVGVGRVDEAGSDLDRALKLKPNYGDALALQSIIAVVQNAKDRALTIAQKAVTADPKSAAALTALSYAQQAHFDLDGARDSLERAVQADPPNALAWARLAEIHMSFGELDEALEAAQKAVSLNPDLSRTQMVLGFSHLLRIDTGAARGAFERAIELDQADALSRLGLGLAKIREGDLADGRRDIEIAASLDPNNALVRSYLGKAYYEEKRIDLAEREYATAEDLDPKDPTPYFYSALQKQTTNRPVEALEDMEKAIELNDNRAIYRSKLQLDSDLAARSASQARIYGDLGFQELALVEGWKSVNGDPTNFSAHRFLADSYSVLPRHEIARVSELLESQLLQPLNMTPIQPRLAEGSLFLVSAGGPGSLSFNEFNPLFNRDGLTVQGSGLAGENRTYSGEGVVSGIQKKAAFSVGGFHYTTDGFRRNADQQDDIGTAFGQVELSPATSIQGEYRYRNNERGDIVQRFFPEDFFPGERNTEERQTGRLGARHSFSPDSIVIGSVTYQHADVKLHDNQVDPFPDDFIDLKRPESAFSTEVQHLFRSRWVNLVTGVGYFDIHGSLTREFGITIPELTPPFMLVNDRQGLDLEHTNIYAYSYVNIVKNVTLTLGASGDITRGESPDTKNINQANPKFGVVWNPFVDTTVRAAAFKVLKRTLITDATIEPTQVAGFNQFYDDFNGTKAWRYGGAVDQKIAKTLFGGIEYARRNLDVAAIGPENDVIRQDEEEDSGRVYIFWAAHKWLALRTEYVFDQFHSQGKTPEPKRVKTHRVPFGFSFFHPSGASAFLTATYVDQSVELSPPDSRTGNDKFFTLDGGVNYRLPRRYGFVTLGVTNLSDKQFKYFERDLKNPSIQPKRMLFGKITLALP
jgi:tetratricopeptide (TPR) repeat protein